ncbi:AQG_2a_G0016630.mRNA.1.CDS.1 [Saccharomyces cerevisiae]|jgi:hypothetical protein|uniref:EC1118_1E8_3356p n=3 Tax=Saccharomyces cerevisiae TaxID=4932 RepID=C8Z7K7_YEAS8|nr:Fmp10p [Saccharomyces cerevisiae YJM993]AJP38449.1 Fmp10p [Saccharomyces cerevisiae YJM1078]AJU40141.1 Fmp10p [Saccharomyces cerevisiae YJM693]AJU40393.1 Fmp10p [Saccharomyces cerevisiae YJM969]AJU40652.1 Fmp10p [Saccharomyces cerevisiae YJM972]AJU40912.1 Fmp10p [Saccharomyces cerevisiae YJM975]AJU41139.1 Fmp10p [Saccharomyces cerevisiae YJM978]AJU41397.1 Fmp10p [Saccharomyces cerevisiae YJM981]AJU41651.1 Fmp10p [Saccharomyces cerevisiae YJM984]AJU41903.1 Fmp10p [Saccharomyces cerevisia
MFKRIAIAQIRTYTNGVVFKTASKSKRRWIPWTIFGGSFLGGWYLTQHMTFTDLLAYWRYDALPKNADEVVKYHADLNRRLNGLPIVKQLENAGFVQVIANEEENLLVSRALNTPGGVAIPPRVYYNPSRRETVGLYHLGMKLTGYPFLIHGGILATVIEDLMKEAIRLEKGTKNINQETKNLSISYKFPTLANQFVVVRTTDLQQYGNKTKLKAELMDQSGNRTLVKANATFSSEQENPKEEK